MPYITETYEILPCTADLKNHSQHVTSCLSVTNRLTVPDKPSPAPETVLLTPSPAPWNGQYVLCRSANGSKTSPATVCPVPEASPLAAPFTSPRPMAPAVSLPVFARLPTAPVAVPPRFLAAPEDVFVAPLATPLAVFVVPETAWLAFLVTGAAFPPVAWSTLPVCNQQHPNWLARPLLPSSGS